MLAPVPSTSVTSATAAKPGARRSPRAASRASVQRLFTMRPLLYAASRGLGIIPAPIVRHWRITMAGQRFSAGLMLALSAAAAVVFGPSAQAGERAIRLIGTPDT